LALVWGKKKRAPKDPFLTVKLFGYIHPSSMKLQCITGVPLVIRVLNKRVWYL
jgi:hypothetical protein